MSYHSNNYNYITGTNSIRPTVKGIYIVKMVSASGKNIRTDKAEWNGEKFLNSKSFGLRDDQISVWYKMPPNEILKEKINRLLEI